MSGLIAERMKKYGVKEMASNSDLKSGSFGYSPGISRKHSNEQVRREHIATFTFGLYNCKKYL